MPESDVRLVGRGVSEAGFGRRRPLTAGIPPGATDAVGRHREGAVGVPVDRGAVRTVGHPGGHGTAARLGEVQLARVSGGADVDGHVDVHGAPGVPAGVDRGDLDSAGVVKGLAASQERLPGQVLRPIEQPRVE